MDGTRSLEVRVDSAGGTGVDEDTRESCERFRAALCLLHMQENIVVRWGAKINWERGMGHILGGRDGGDIFGVGPSTADARRH